MADLCLVHFMDFGPQQADLPSQPETCLLHLSYVARRTCSITV